MSDSNTPALDAWNAQFSNPAKAFQEAERLRSKARHDEASALHHARHEKALDIAKIMLADGEPIEKITRYTDLPREEIEKLQQ